MTRYKTIAVAFSLLLAIAAPLGMAWQSVHNRTAYDVVRFDIEPYDPRDLMYGHYLLFRINWNFSDAPQDVAACHGKNCCLCIGDGEENPPAYVAQCLPADERGANCARQIKGTSWSPKEFQSGIDRYYVDEALALPLEKLFTEAKEKFAVGLSLAPKGKAHIEGLYVGGEPLGDYVSSHGGKIPDAAPPALTP